MDEAQLKYCLMHAPEWATLATMLCNGPINGWGLMFAASVSKMEDMLNRSIDYPPTKVGEASRILLGSAKLGTAGVRFLEVMRIRDDSLDAPD